LFTDQHSPHPEKKEGRKEGRKEGKEGKEGGEGEKNLEG